MHIFRRVVVYTVSSGCLLAVSLLVWLLALQASLLSADTVKGWLRGSGVYDRLLTELISVQTDASDNIVAPEIVKQALAKTFTPEFVRQHTERVVDAVYAWLEGKTPRVIFAVPIDQKKSELVQHIKTSLEPRLAQLPICQPNTGPTSNQTATCRPPGQELHQLATAAAQDAVNDSHLFDQPLTQDSFAGILASQDVSLLGQLPVYRQWVNYLFIGLPLAILVGAGIIFAVAADKSVAFMRLGRRIFFGSVLTVGLGLGSLYFVQNGSALSMIGALDSANGVANVLAPVVQKILQGILLPLVLYSVIAAAVGLAVWLGLRFINNKRRRSTLLQPPRQTPRGTTGNSVTPPALPA